MSFFPRFTHEISPVFRLLDDYERASRHALRGTDSTLRTFSPKFDVKEHKDAYHLHGEFPGVCQEDINIEWSDGNTLTVSGRTEHHAESGQRLQAIEAGDNKEYQKPTIEEEGQAEETEQLVAVMSDKQVAQHNANEPKYWVSERSVGEFHRSFSFPSRIDQDAVKASLKNGVLSIVVPKAQTVKSRKVNIES